MVCMSGSTVRRARKEGSGRGAIEEPEMGEPSITGGENDTYIYGAALAMLRACSIPHCKCEAENG